MIKNEKKSNLIYRCARCKKRNIVDELEELGYIEQIGKSKYVTCPNCEDQGIIE